MSEKVYGAGALEATYQNLLLNPSFETVLPGTHTAAIKTHAVAGTTKNTQFPGWQGVTPAGTPSMTIDASTATFNAPGKQSMKVSAVTLGTASAALFVEQRWNATHFLDNFAAMCAGLIVTAACDIKLVNPVASAFRIGISVDGGSNYTYSPYKANDTNWERLIVSLAGGSAPTDVRFRLSFEAGSTIEYYVDNIMVVVAPTALETLTFVPRNPISLSQQIDISTGVDHTAGSTAYIVTGSAGFSASDYNINNSRPHWAGAATFLAECSRNSTDAQTNIRTNGYTNSTLSAGNFTTNTVWDFNSGDVDIGIDGQVEVQVSGSGARGIAIVKRWVGGGL